MINLDELRTKYENYTGIELRNEEGDARDFYREYNEVIKPVVGRWHENPIPLTAVKRPFCGIATVDITVLSHPDKWEETQKSMNDFATAFNGTSKEVDDHGTIYSVSYNCQTCGVISRVHDVGVGVGEVFELNQQISLIIIESGVSAYDTHLYIDGIEVPFLSIVETKTHTTSLIPSSKGITKTISEQEAYGIDLIVPYMRDELGRMLRNVIDYSTGNEAHCVVLDIGGEKSCHIMQITQTTSNIQPPQNIGVNFSLVELQPNIAKYNALWQKTTFYGREATVYISEKLEVDQNAQEFTVFWGDGESNHYTSNSGDIGKHVYTDGMNEHEVIVFITPKRYYKQIKQGDIVYGKTIYLLAPENKWDVVDYMEEEGKDRVFFSNENGVFALFAKEGRIGYEDREIRGRSFIDKRGEDGRYYIYGVTKTQCFIKDAISFVDDFVDICTSLWDGEVGEVTCFG